MPSSSNTPNPNKSPIQIIFLCAALVVIILVISGIGISVKSLMDKDHPEQQAEATAQQNEPAATPSEAPQQQIKSDPTPAPALPLTPLPKGAYSFMGFFVGQNRNDITVVAQKLSFSLSCGAPNSGVVQCVGKIPHGTERGRSGITLLVLSLIDGELYKVEYWFPREDYDLISHQMLDKFGDPTGTTTQPVIQDNETYSSRWDYWMNTSMQAIVLKDRIPDSVNVASASLVSILMMKDAADRGVDGTNPI